MNVLIIAPAWVGDMIMSQVLYKVLEGLHQNLQLTVVAPAQTAVLAMRMPEVMGVETLPVGHGELGFWVRYQLGKKLSREAYNQAFVLPNSLKSALVPFWAGIQKRTGWRGECRYGLLNDLRVLDTLQYPRMVDRFAALAYESGQTLPSDLPHPKLDVDYEAQSALLGRLGLQVDRPILVLCPGAE